MKNSENAAMPMSTIGETTSAPFHLSGKVEQTPRRPSRSSSRISTPTVNQKTRSRESDFSQLKLSY
ncbi:hypothetical protein SAMN05444581_10149 [Methylocapsa palsarum]|uniref:Uncharacterized protein n=1 Tax=Methylocapsa palsarum TaxID=1612308 RepID=A0A1I3VR83_9HYPH|nr:hypothetical protein SAMN05444581_10149 [Methylocapsa palsarum]